jgi:ABC-type phosphate transport system substrate-binding protein
MRGAAAETRGRWLALCVLLACIAADAPLPSREPVAVIVADDWEGFEAIDLASLRSLYLGRRTRWEGRRVRCFGLPPGSPSRSAFSNAVLGRSEEDLDRFWIEQALLGGALPPREVASPAEMIRAVRSTPGAIGYLPLESLRAAEAAGVRMLAIATDGAALAPPAPGYPIAVPVGARGEAH